MRFEPINSSSIKYMDLYIFTTCVSKQNIITLQKIWIITLK